LRELVWEVVLSENAHALRKPREDYYLHRTQACWRGIQQRPR
jgi:hypothetical protein